MLYAIPEITGNIQRTLRGLRGSFVCVERLFCYYAAARPRSGERLGSEGLAVAANGASGGKENVD